jgi:pilus assembly protein FimV
VAVNRTKVLEAAQKFLSKGQYDKAIAEYQKLVGEDPRDVRTLLKIGDLHTRRNKPKDAIDIYEKVAELYAKQGFFLKAVAVYKQILKLDPTQLSATLKLAQMYEELALASDALSTYEQAADALLAQGQTDRALETMQRMIALDGQNVAARIKYAEALSKADRPREAATAFSDGARLLREQGRIDDYIRVVERQLYHDPDNVNIARELASKYLERNDPKRALAKLQVCFKADPRDVQTLEMLAEAFRQLGQIPKTVSVLKEIARLHAEVNADEPRRRTLMRVLDLDPSDAEARQALAAPTPRVTRATEGGAPRTTQATDPGAARSTHATEAGAHRAQPAAPAARAPEATRQAPKLEEPEEPEFETEDELSLDDAVEDSGEAVLMVAESAPPEEPEEPTVESLLAEAETHEANSDYMKAEQALRNALLLDEELAEVHERLKDVYLATDRRVDAVRELLWLSEASSQSDPGQAVSYARAALQLAPRAEATRRRLAALGLDPTTGEPPVVHQNEEVVFVDDSVENAARDEKSTAWNRPLAETGASAQHGWGDEQEEADPLELPISPDEFELAAPRAHALQRGPTDIAALLDRPISAEEFDSEREPEFEPEPTYEGELPDVASLLDSPISPDEFDAPPPRVPSARPAYDLLAEAPVDDFGLSDDRFDRSDLHEVSPLSEPVAEQSQPPVLQVVEEEENYDELLSDDIDLTHAAEALEHDQEREFGEESIEDLDRVEKLAANLAGGQPTQLDAADDDAEWLRDLPEPTVPAEPIPELIRRSSQKNLEAVAGDTVRPAATPFAAAAAPAPATRTPEPAAPAKPAPAPSEVIPPEVEEALDEASFFASQGLFDEALEVVQEAILIYPKSAALKVRLAEYEARADEQEAAAETHEEDAALDESFDIAEQLASQLADVPAPAGHDEMVDVESVFAQFKKGVAAQIAEDDTDTHFDLGIAYKEMGLIDDAIGEFEISAKSPKRACTALTMVGMCHIEKGDAPKAVSYFERALSQPVKAPAEELALGFEIANAYEVSGQLEKALASFEKVASRDRTFRGVLGRIEQLKRRGVSPAASRATH